MLSFIKDKMDNYGYWFKNHPSGSRRRWFAERLRWIADRVGPEDAFHESGGSFQFQIGVGQVHHNNMQGVPLYYRRSEYDDRRFADDETADLLKKAPWNQ